MTARRSAGGGPVLDRRTLNRTLLARQGLLTRTRIEPLALIERLVGLQAQEPIDPYVGLWTRIEDFDPLVLSRALEDRRVVRIGTMRTTIHLLTVDDALGIAPLTAPIHRRVFNGQAFRRSLAGAAFDEIAADARQIVEAEPTPPAELGRQLAARWSVDPAVLAAVARFGLPLVQVPPRGLWRRSGRAAHTTLGAWTGREPVAHAIDDVVLRYLRAFGPATVGDLRTWSGLTSLRDVVDRLRPQLRTYRDERRRELFDTLDGTIIEADHPAPIRFLPQFDNVFLSHEDRARINGSLSWGLDFGWKGVLLVDGEIAGAWRIRRAKQNASMTVELGRPLTPTERRELDAEAERLSIFLDPDRVRSIEIVDPD
jgi:hypothetical protein